MGMKLHSQGTFTYKDGNYSFFDWKSSINTKLNLLELTNMASCKSCGGTGRAACPHCHGKGSCKGTGCKGTGRSTNSNNKCIHCKGTGNK